MKNLNNARQSRAEWAEFFALSHLCAWYNKVRPINSPGLRIKIVFDDSTIRMANRHAHDHMASYMKSVKRLVVAMGYESFIVGTMRQSSFAWLFHFGLYQLAERACDNGNESRPRSISAIRNRMVWGGFLVS